MLISSGLSHVTPPDKVIVLQQYSTFSSTHCEGTYICYTNMSYQSEVNETLVKQVLDQLSKSLYT